MQAGLYLYTSRDPNSECYWKSKVRETLVKPSDPHQDSLKVPGAKSQDDRPKMQC